jgi:uncharacterized protein (TIGR02246 family)
VIGVAATEEIRALHRELLDAWNRHDAAGMAGLFAPDGNLVGFDGSTVDGRGEIELSIGKIFADHETASYVATVREVRLLAPDVALLRAAVGMVPPGRHDINPDTNAIQALVATRQDGGWQVALFQNTLAAFHGRPEAAQALTDELRRLVPADR